MTRLPALFVALLACPIEAMAQDCIATAQAPDAVWSAVPVNVTGNAPLKLMTHLRLSLIHI